MPFTICPFRRLLPLVYHSSACALITLLLLSTSPVYAEWVALGDKYQTPGLQTLYIDPDTIRRKGNLVSLELLVDWNWMQGNRSPTGCRSNHQRV